MKVLDQLLVTRQKTADKFVLKQMTQPVYLVTTFHQLCMIKQHIQSASKTFLFPWKTKIVTRITKKASFSTFEWCSPTKKRYHTELTVSKSLGTTRHRSNRCTIDKYSALVFSKYLTWHFIGRLSELSGVWQVLISYITL